jgi:ethanolamine utilization protein
MDQLEEIIQLVTDKLMEKLSDSTPGKIFSFWGEPKDFIIKYYEQQGMYYSSDCDILNHHIIILTETPFFLMKRIHNMSPMNKNEIDLMNRLLSQKKVVIFKEGIEFTNNKEELPNGIKKMMSKTISDLQDYGVEVKSSNDFKYQRSDDRNSKSLEMKQKKELVTIKKIQALGLNKGDLFTITPNMIVTALAKDYLRDYHIQVEERDA